MAEGGNREGVGLGTETVDGIGDVVDTDFTAVGVNVGVRSADVSESVTGFGSGLT